MDPIFSSFSFPVLNTVVHPYRVCTCGNLRHDTDCPLFGTCPFCGLNTTTCIALGRCAPLFHPVRHQADNTRRQKRLEDLIRQCDRFGGILHTLHCQQRFPPQLLRKMANLNATYTAVKSRASSAVSVSSLNEMETCLAKLRRLYIEVKASRAAQPAQPSQPFQLSQPSQPAQPAQPSQRAKRSKKAKLAGIAKPAGN